MIAITVAKIKTPPKYAKAESSIYCSIKDAPDYPLRRGD
jgi:hypothetical protein